MPGIVYPWLPYPTSATNVFANVHIAKGSGMNKFRGLGVKDSITTDSIWYLQFLLPPVLPTETMKLKLLAMADAQTGIAKVNPFWNKSSPEDDPSGVTLQPEGTSDLTWSTGDDDVWKELKITLDAGTAPSGNDIILMELRFVASGYTLAAVSTWFPTLIWE